MSAIEITEQQPTGGFATTWLLTLVPNRSKFGGVDGGRDSFEHSFRVLIRRMLNDIAAGQLFNMRPVGDGTVLVQYAFERGGKRHGLHCHALISGTFPARGAKLEYSAIRTRICGQLGSCVHVNARLLRGVMSLQHALRYVAKRQPPPSNAT
jgi:hypothetical protein